MSARAIASVLAAAIAFAGCRTTAQKQDRTQSFGSETDAEVGDVPVRGHFVNVYVEEGPSKSGELLSVSNRELVVLDEDSDEGVAVLLDEVRFVEVEDVWNARSGGGASWVVLGTLSTISHGLVAILSVPVWILTGVPAVLAGELSNDVDFRKGELQKLRAFARYPISTKEALNRKKQAPPRFMTRTSSVSEEGVEPGGPRLGPIDPQPPIEPKD